MAAARPSASSTPAADPARTPWFADLQDGAGAAAALEPALRRVLASAVLDIAAEQAERIVAAEESRRAARAAEEAERRRLEVEARERLEAERAELRRAELHRIRTAVRRAARRAFGLRLVLVGTVVGSLQILVTGAMPPQVLESIQSAMTSPFREDPLRLETIPTVFGAAALVCVVVLLVVDLVLGPPARRPRRVAAFLACVVGTAATALQWRGHALTYASWAWLPLLVTVAHIACGAVSGVRVRVRLGEPVTVEEASTGLR